MVYILNLRSAAGQVKAMGLNVAGRLSSAGRAGSGAAVRG
jgi:hypothetical protein